MSMVGREIRGMHHAAYVLAGFALGSQLLALVRDRLLAAHFGAGHTLDIYYAGFRIPDLLFATVASLLSLYALLPVLSKFEAVSQGQMVSFLRHTLLFFFVAMGAIALALFFFVPKLVLLVAPGLSDVASRADLVLLIRILLLQPILLGASNIVAALTQLRHRFLLYSISPLLYNIGIIFGIVALYPRFGLAGLGWGVVFGATMHFLVQVPFFSAEKSEPLPAPIRWKGLAQVLTLSVPRTLALAAGQLSLLALVALASFLAPGSIAVFMFAWNLQAVPLTIIGVSYSVAAFPTLARFHASGEREAFVGHIEAALRHIFFWSIPAMVLALVLRAQLVRIILGAGAFDWAATRLTAAALALFVLSLTAQSVVLLFARAYYAAGKTKTPLVMGMVSVIVTVASALILSFGFHASQFWRFFLESILRVSDVGGTTVLMLALSFTIGSLLQATGALIYLKKEFSISYAGLSRLAFQSFSAAVLGGAAAYGALAVVGFMVDINTVAGIATQGVLGGIVGLLVTGGILLALGNPEIAEAYASIKRRFEGEPQVALEPTDVSS